MKRLAVALAFAALVLSAPARAAGPLDGRSYVGEMGEKGKEKGDKDTYVFKDGTFRSTACDSYGFGDAPYMTRTVGSKMIVSAETSSKKEGRMDWTLTIEGDAITGRVLWTRGSKVPREYWVKGTLKK